ncbi:MAG: hypothetical protein ACRD47_11720 [Nitrososphaeraceae archaeon]
MESAVVLLKVIYYRATMSILLVAAALAWHDLPSPEALTEEKLLRSDIEHIRLVYAYLKAAKRGIQKGDDPPIVGLHIRALGRLKAEQAVPFLIDNITYSGLPRKMRFGSPPSSEERNPCIYALIKIGYPAIDPLLDRVASDQQFNQSAAARVLVLSLGAEQAKALVRLRISKENEQSKSDRLLHLMKSINDQASRSTRVPRKP